ncbi:putative maleylacetoacetate isomerase 2 [Brevipalpus obovatus]|uniref:putative maleylacetoacetate isomerase 2 n=1 Tax=Brevipalpus obovatus TaxID=246614 RepID=UPI003D9ED60D
MVKPILYSYFRSSCSYRVRIMLELKKVPFEYRAVDLHKDGGEQHLSEYKRLNPFGYIPALVVTEDDGKTHTLFESMAIVDYLEQKYPQNSIYPKDLIERTNSLAIAETITSGIQPFQNVGFIKMFDDLGIDKNKWSKDWITKKFQSLEKVLETTCGKYCVGNTISIADIFLAPQVYNALKFEVDMSKFPIINRIVNELEKNEAFQKAHPSVQPDTPSEFRKS